jgi:prepilin-type N-terminal cleavage/methylation domain-containing protein
MASAKGYTAMELILVVAIICVLVAIMDASWDTLKARARGSEARASMDSIAMAGYIDYTNNNTTMWAAYLCGSMPPEFAAGNLLPNWPEAPCPGWTYCWENWSDNPPLPSYPKVAVTLRNANGIVVWNYCVNTFGGAADCALDPMNSPASLIAAPYLSVMSDENKYLYCNEPVL